MLTKLSTCEEFRGYMRFQKPTRLDSRLTAVYVESSG